MATITASVDAARGVVWIEVDYASDPSVSSVRIVRVITATGEEENVRIHSWLSDEGLDCMTLVGSSATTYDTEAPLDIPVYYRLEDCAESALSVDSAEVMVPSGGRFWLKDPLRPYNNVAIVQRGDRNSCLPASGVYFRSMGEESFPGAGAIQRAVNRRNGVAVVRVRHGYSSTLSLATRQFADRDAVRDLLSTGDVLLLQGPASYGIPEVYIHVPGTPAWQRLSNDHKKQWRLVAIPFDEVDRPAGLSYGVAGTRWEDMCDVYSSFAAMEAAGISWRDVMAGLAGDIVDAIVSGWRTYSRVSAEFATYSAISPESTAASDNFNRVVANDWGTSTTGQVWTTLGGVAANYSVSGTEGGISLTTVNVPRETILPVSLTNLNMVWDKIVIGGGVVPAGAPITSSITARLADANNMYICELLMGTDDSTTLRLRKMVAGTITLLATYSLGLSASGTAFAVRFRLQGELLRARAWNRSLAEPTAWQITTIDTSLVDTGDVGTRVTLETGNSNVLPVTFAYDNMTVFVTDRSYQELLEGD